MKDSYRDDDFTPQEKQERFEAAVRAALKTPLKHRPAKEPTSSPRKTEATGRSSASSAT
jgi:hypothetical protein